MKNKIEIHLYILFFYISRGVPDDLRCFGISYSFIFQKDFLVIYDSLDYLTLLYFKRRSWWFTILWNILFFYISIGFPEDLRSIGITYSFIYFKRIYRWFTNAIEAIFTLIDVLFASFNFSQTWSVLSVSHSKLVLGTIRLEMWYICFLIKYFTFVIIYRWRHTDVFSKITGSLKMSSLSCVFFAFMYFCYQTSYK